MAWTIIITAPAVSVKKVHKALISLEDYEYGVDHSWTIFHNTTHLDDETDLKTPNTPPLDLSGAQTLDSTNNAFAGKTPSEVFEFVQENEKKLGGKGLTTMNLLIIDDRGFREESCLVCSINDEDDDEDEEEEEEEEEDDEGDRSPFVMARLPWVEAWIMFTNLDIGNMGFDEYVDEEKGKDENGEYTWKGSFSEGSEDEEATKKREEALKKAREEGIIE
ncbi:hypothetical protein P170DRAFT_468889 [Aspergillus steynii IBT 23096]|uniref:Uncharacterized protein n=1 Tax=Aspergillus steynii IBT 23096 TaxID=1392250 RepID=A0A2I2FRF5_9EURO|nr:uncharacterized protein P170DRAFT_468889 [Aspergillus steynii IBT 23096]PLB43218.1 hypothetical protein P170DRAFT_468889 [Aspergillus steynii IBT 23096]